MPATVLQGKLVSALGSTNRTVPAEPWNMLSEAYVQYDGSKHYYALRTGMAPARVKRYAPYIEAAGLYCRTSYDPTTPQFRMVEQRNGQNVRTIVEARSPDDSSFIVQATNNKLRISIVEPDMTRTHAQKFADIDAAHLKWIVLALLPHILAIDNESGNDKIQDAVKTLSKAMDDQITSPWLTKNDIPDIVKDAAYFLDVIHTVISNKMELDCGDNTQDIPGEIDDSYFLAPASANSGLSGALLCEYIDPNEWEPKFVKATGQGRKFTSSRMTIGEAKQIYSIYSDGRNWSPAEREMIQDLPDDMLLMPEVEWFAKLLIDSEADNKPLRNFGWRGTTAYGKSTGIKQLSCILNIPLLIYTCGPKTDENSFRLTIVPDGKTEKLPVNMDNLMVMDKVSNSDTVSDPLVAAALANLQKLSQEEADKILDAENFFQLAYFDPDYAAEWLLGQPEAVSFPQLARVYTDMQTVLKKAPLVSKLAEYEAAVPNKEKDESRAEFLHVFSPYLKAMINGYLVEVQEPSRIKDPGVLVSLNEFDRPGAKMQLMNGYTATRHNKAICVFSDNVGYVSCRPIDPSHIRRLALVRDSFELSKDLLFSRVTFNTGIKDTALMEKCYKIWDEVAQYCRQNNINDGCISAEEFENIVKYFHRYGPDHYDEVLHDFLISKATNNQENQREILTVCSTLI